LRMIAGTHCVMTTKRTGRPSKGDRVTTFVRLPRRVREAVEQMADDEGLPMSDVLVRIVCEALGHSVPDHCYPKTIDQTELPIAQAS
jgi:hypothetical protein